MFLTKKDVDKHCQDVLSKCKNEKDRNLRCLSIAQQYANVRDFESARRYVTLFLSVRDDSPIAHKLLAQCLEHFGEKDKALSEYKYSLSLDPKQPELYLKVCELYADSSVIVDKNEARYWQDKAEAQFPYHSAVQKLKTKMFAIGDSKNGKSLESVLLDELREKSNDLTVNVKLLNFYIDNGRFREAYDQAFKKKINFVPNLFWYQSCVQICKSYPSQFPSLINEEFYGNYLLALERSLALSVQDVKMRRISIPEGVALLASFDELLSEAIALKSKSERFLLLINHMCGQLCFHTAHILYRKAKWEDKNWPEMAKLISPMLLLSTANRFDIRAAKEEGPFSQIFKTCILVCMYRFNQAGYILTALAKDSPNHFIEKIFHFCVSSYWKERVCETIYNTSNYKKLLKSCFFMKFDGFSHLPDELPKNVTDDIDQFLSVSETLYPSSLHHLVWIGVHYLNISNKESIYDSVLPLKFTVKFTGSLQFSPNSSSSYAENLSKIDIEAFLFACVYCAKSLLDQQIDRSKPLASYILPADVSKLLCSPDHDLWWEYVNQMINQTIAESNFSRARSIIQRGIENIRLIRNNVLPLHLLVLLGRTFANKATVESDNVRASALESRALLYWRTALPLLEKALHKETYSTSCKSMFEYQEKIITPSDAAKLIAEGKRFVNMQELKDRNYSDLMCPNESFEEPRTAASSFSQTAYSVHHSANDALLKTLYEQNIKIIDKLETLFSKQELLSSNQFQLFETISTLSKKIDDVLIVPNDCYLDALSASEQPASPHNASQVTNASLNSKPASSVPIQPLIGNNFYQMPANVQTNFPMYSPFGHSTLAPPSTASFLNSYLPVMPPSFPQAPFQNFQFVTDTKESYSTTNRSIASSCVFNMNTPPTAVPARISQPFPPPMAFNEVFDQNTSQTFGETKLFQETYSGSAKSSEVPSNSAVTPSFSFQNKTSFFQQVSSSPASVSEVVSTAPHSFQIPNVINSPVLVPSVQVPEDEDESDDAVVEHDPIPDFKPIIPLPDEVDVKTGEEEEEILLENRAKLYRFVDKEWKERGTGPLKILKNKADGRVRILMRREAVHKICANHVLTNNMNLTPKGDRAWIYYAIDFADGERSDEKLCVKFQTPEIASKFYKVFNENKKSYRTPVASPLSKSITPTSTSSPFVQADDRTKKIVIAPSILNVESPQKKPVDSCKTQVGGFTFSAKPIFTTLPEKKETMVVDDKKKTPFASFGGFSLNTLTPSEGESKVFSSVAVTSLAPSFVKSEDKNSTLFCTAENVLDFSSLIKNVDNTAFAKSKNFKGFAGAGAPVFGVKSAQTKPTANTSDSPVNAFLNITPSRAVSSPKSTESPQDVTNEGEYEPTAEFTPVIPLPDLVEVKTGEEGLEVLYEEHCKLFRYTDDQWKERGVGKMKILRDPKDGTIRLLMRRDQVHKLCCNQRLTPNQRLRSLNTTDKAWSWLGKDFSEGELKDELLCVRFKTSDLANAFKEAFDNAKERLSETPQLSTDVSTAPTVLPSLSEMFKRDQSKWDCTMCYISNEKDATVCVACEQPKDGVVQAEPTKPSVFGASSGSFKFSSNVIAATTTSATAFSFGIPAVTSAFTFGLSAATTVSSVNVPMPGHVSQNITTSGPIITALSAPVFSFGTAPQQSESGGSLFGNANFLFGDKSESLTKSSGNEPTAEGKSETISVGSSIFGGTGINNSAKMVDNSSAFSSFSFNLAKNSGDTSFNVTESKITSDEEKRNALISKQSSSDDIEFVSETEVPEEDKKLATWLCLPPNYFAYKYSVKNCPGCVGCDEEDQKIVGKPSNESSELNKPPKSVDSSTNLKIPSSSNSTLSVPNSTGAEKRGFHFGQVDSTVIKLSLDKTFNFGNLFNQSNISSSASTPKKNEDNDNSDNEDDNVVPNEQDPYFEPIIPLPKLVDTKTGEEEEIIEFCERSKLFRYDEDKKEWKERGVGDLKILFHPTQKTYRLLLRREQVHKVVLNQRITNTLSLQRMSTNTKSWCWFGMNLPEEQSEPVVEKLAVRFKNEEIAKKFEEVVLQCITRLNSDNDHECTAEDDAYEVNAVSDGDECGEQEYDGYDQDYVDEHEIIDAMADFENSEFILEIPALLKIFEGDSVADYDGIVRLWRKNLDVSNSDDSKGFVDFSTHDIPSLYYGEIDKNCQAFLENDCVTILNDSGAERKVTIQFKEKELSQEFFDIYEMLK